MSSQLLQRTVKAMWSGLIAGLAMLSVGLIPCSAQERPLVPHRYEPQVPTQTPEGDVVALKTQDGMLIIWNRSVPYFTMTVHGSDFAGYGPQAVYFKVDGVFLQVLNVEATSFLHDPSRATVEQVLNAHRDWDFANMKRVLGEKSIVRSVFSQLDDGTPVLYWEVTPEKKLNPSAPGRYLMVTRVFEGSVIGATSVEEVGVSLERAKSLVFQAIRGTRFSPGPVDVARLQRELRGE